MYVTIKGFYKAALRNKDEVMRNVTVAVCVITGTFPISN